ncbi:MAG TPA: sulfite exporter TauE/SafE family protein [Gemmatimonadales bacterium]|nr:sulfite exporter TauE/SafE family protein [Gemmatimonadales bacterium]
MTTALILLTVMLGAAAQRITGMGFAIISAPILVLLLGGFDGVLMVNLGACFTSALMFARVWREVQWRRWRLLVVGAAFGVIPGVWILTLVPADWLELAVGVIIVLGLVAAGRVSTSATSDGRYVVMASGAVSGLMNAAAGIGGPAVTVYAVATSWDQRSFAATLQPYSLIVGGMSFSAMLTVHGATHGLEPWLWAPMLATCATGLVLGEWLRRQLSAVVAYRLLLILAVLGALAAAVRGGSTIAGL